MLRTHTKADRNSQNLQCALCGPQGPLQQVYWRARKAVISKLGFKGKF